MIVTALLDFGLSYSDICVMSWPRIVFWHEQAVAKSRAEAEAYDEVAVKAKEDAKRKLEGARMTNNPGLLPA